MTNEITFYKMHPTDFLLSNHDAKKVWCLSEKGNQYLVFTSNGDTFDLQLEAGVYKNIKWIDTKTGNKTTISAVAVSNNAPVTFKAPNALTDWVLVVKN